VRIGAGSSAGSSAGGAGGDWATAQRDLSQAYLTRTAAAERHPVKILWWTAAGTGRPDVMGLVSRLWVGRRTRPVESQVFVALYEAADPVGTRPFLVIRARPDSFTTAHGRAIATVVGRAEPEGALVIETRRGPVLPAESPGLPGDDAPPGSEVDAAG
jgi:hypothetical protein